MSTNAASNQAYACNATKRQVMIQLLFWIIHFRNLIQTKNVSPDRGLRSEELAIFFASTL